LKIIFHDGFWHKFKVKETLFARGEDHNFIGDDRFSFGDSSVIFEINVKRIDESFVFFIIIVDLKIPVFDSKNLAEVLILGVIWIDFKFDLSLSAIDK
jgi:hypothetical protein